MNLPLEYQADTLILKISNGTILRRICPGKIWVITAIRKHREGYKISVEISNQLQETTYWEANYTVQPWDNLIIYVAPCLFPLAPPRECKIVRWVLKIIWTLIKSLFNNTTFSRIVGTWCFKLMGTPSWNITLTYHKTSKSFTFNSKLVCNTQMHPNKNLIFLRRPKQPWMSDTYFLSKTFTKWLRAASLPLCHRGVIPADTPTWRTLPTSYYLKYSIMLYIIYFLQKYSIRTHNGAVSSLEWESVIFDPHTFPTVSAFRVRT